MADFEKVIKGLEHCGQPTECDGCPYDTGMAGGCFTRLKMDALALLKAQEKRQALEVHNISNVDIPDGVTEAQFYAVMNNVVEALEHTDRGESWPYDEKGGEKNG